MSSILSTSVCCVGTQTTSLPGWPTRGSKVGALAGACANALAATNTRPRAKRTRRMTCNGFISLLRKINLGSCTLPGYQSRRSRLAGRLEKRRSDDGGRNLVAARLHRDLEIHD